MFNVIAAILDSPQDLNLPTTAANESALAQILSVVFGLVGVICLIVIVLGGFRYIVSQGDPNNISRAKNTILYALVGLIVSLTAFSIVRFVVQGVQ